MLINTKYLGEMDINEDNVVEFSKGLPGFVDSKRFAMLEVEDDDKIKVLQDIDDEHVSFIIISPWDFYSDYDIDVPNEKLTSIGIDHNSVDILDIFNIVTLEEEFKDSTANLLAPIFINTKDKKGIQLILNDEKYSTKHKLFTEVEKDADTK